MAINNIFSLEVKIAQDIAEKLNKHYPGHMWGVNADVNNGITTIQAVELSTEYGYLLHLADLDIDLKCVVRAGGEILERFRVKRGAHKESEIANLSRNIKGNALHDE